jgi:hypothetical protein
MKLSSALSALSLFLPLAPAYAAPAGDNVVVIRLDEVRHPARLPGACAVRAHVREVWHGSAYRVGQAISIAVPCGRNEPVLDERPARPTYGPMTQDIRVLRRSATAAVHLDDAGALIWAPSRPHRNLYVVGYHPLTATMLPEQARS